MANFNFLSSMGLAGFDFNVILSKVYFFGGIFLLCIILGIIGFAIYFIKNKNKIPKDLKKIYWWEQTIAGMVPTTTDNAEEIVIPGTSLRVFYVKERDLWLPRFTKGITKDTFFVCMTPNRQMVNFTLKNLGEDLKGTGLEFDNTDMLWAAENTRDFIKRNYKDKGIKWWQAYQGVITTAIYLLIITFSVCLILYMLKGVVDKIGFIMDQLSTLIKQTCISTATSGIAPA